MAAVSKASIASTAIVAASGSGSALAIGMITIIAQRRATETTMTALIVTMSVSMGISTLAWVLRGRLFVWRLLRQ
ncbi:MAG: hypothetical protein J3R72DRAFT_457728 [Linnemannia gamsii]|nr:MAG: hypothetical protein J3R72DRAFT_457728 [Linnemannia gamsii]